MRDVFFGPEGTLLHGVLLSAELKGAPAAVICHPHPQYGGSMHNNVVLGIETALADAGITTLRFNFRGVGRSGGAFDGGRGEQDDVRRAIDFLSADSSTGPIHLAGYSFGAFVGLIAAINDERIASLSAIAPPTAIGSFAFITDCKKPLLAVAGSQDEFCSISEIKPLVDKIHGRLEIIPGADHFFLNQEQRAGGFVRDFILGL